MESSSNTNVEANVFQRKNEPERMKFESVMMQDMVIDMGEVRLHGGASVLVRQVKVLTRSGRAC